MAGSTGFSGTERVLFFGAMILMTIQTTYLVLSVKHFGIFENHLGDKSFNSENYWQVLNF